MATLLTQPVRPKLLVDAGQQYSSPRAYHPQVDHRQPLFPRQMCPDREKGVLNAAPRPWAKQVQEGRDTGRVCQPRRLVGSALTKPDERYDKPGKPGKRLDKFAKKESNSRQILLFFYLRLFAWIWQYLTNMVGVGPI